ncbi:hypothetical protein RchiOBHm_Chr1g0313541 [Rosa chinensis]|uniref:Uncharacterized protein n=1 Tax=Rosa chinensis TaxID=74649 RepID=A0A2P6S6Z1_ROSCH|nr:hypothetical protein RchiOBHm_Chr1g0313541 [Rosa chinensis]
MNASNDAAEGRLLAQLTQIFDKQHFEPAEVGMLARCFCIPLVSVLVGKINKQGILLCPTNSKYILKCVSIIDIHFSECASSPLPPAWPPSFVMETIV